MSIADEIARLKKSKNAVILAHNYQRPEVQDVADFVGDSLELSMKAAATGCDVIVFCGVDFMAETAKILNPDKTVLVPDPDAGCPLSEQLLPRDVERQKAATPEASVVLYINTTAACKALADVVCTSANCVEVIRAAPSRQIIFGPDSNLLHYASKRVPEKELIGVPVFGYCPTHHNITPAQVSEAKTLHPGAKVIVHPECTPEVQEMADFIASTSGMVRIAKADPAQEFILGTESGLLHRLGRDVPGKKFYAASPAVVCPNMKKNTLEKVRDVLVNENHEIVLPGGVIEKARVPIERMLELTRKWKKY